MAAKNKTFDAVEMSRRLREDTSRLLASMSRKEKIAFLNRHLEQFSQTLTPEDRPAKASVSSSGDAGAV